MDLLTTLMRTETIAPFRLGSFLIDQLAQIHIYRDVAFSHSRLNLRASSGSTSSIGMNRRSYSIRLFRVLIVGRTDNETDFRVADAAPGLILVVSISACP